MRDLMFFIVAGCFVVNICCSVVRTDLSAAPVLSDTHDVQFFILESAFPYNAPASLQDTVGEVFRKYYVTHAGLGVWDITSGQKFSIEFVSEGYLGAVLPTLNSSTQQLDWQNAGKITITTPTDPEGWISSQLVCVSSGTAYNQLITYLQKHEDLYTVYQPVEAIYYNITELLNTVGEFVGSGQVQVAPTDSFWFVNTMINQLSTYGATIESYLDIYATAFQYLASNNAAPTVVRWSHHEATNKDVVHWYKNLTYCYYAAYDDAQNSVFGGVALITNLRSCYGEYAYIYRDMYSVYNLTLMGNHSQSAVTPKLTKYKFDLLDNGTGHKEHLQPIDFVLLSVVFLGIVLGVYSILRCMCRKPVRRRVSMQGEMVAVRTVNKVDQLSIKTGSGGDGAQADDKDVVQSYYRTKSADDVGVVRNVFSATVGVAMSTVNTVTSIGAGMSSVLTGGGGGGGASSGGGGSGSNSSHGGEGDSSKSETDSDSMYRTSSFTSFLPFGGFGNSSSAVATASPGTPIELGSIGGSSGNRLKSGARFTGTELTRRTPSPSEKIPGAVDAGVYSHEVEDNQV